MGDAVKDGAVSKQDLDAALIHLFSVQFRLGHFDPASIQPYRQIPPSAVNSPKHQALALEAALQSLVLLKNDGPLLPLSTANFKTLAVVGPNADATNTMQGNYYGVAPYLISPVQGLAKFAKTNFVHGCDINSQDKSGFNAACSAAQTADATVIVVGLDQSQESEGNDRYAISFPGVQSQFISQIATCSKGPVIAVYVN